jgi:Na+/H+-translocating membrane pyrophosphatase
MVSAQVCHGRFPELPRGYARRTAGGSRSGSELGREIKDSSTGFNPVNNATDTAVQVHGIGKALFNALVWIAAYCACNQFVNQHELGYGGQQFG